MKAADLSRKADEAVERVRDHPSMTTIRSALDIAREAAKSGDRLDQGRVVGLLSLAQGVCDDESEVMALAGEAIARTMLLAEDGCDLCKALLPTLVNASPREAVRLSMKYRIQLCEGQRGKQ